MIGTIVNTVAVVVGGTAGTLLKKGIKPSYQDTLNKALGAAVFVTGINGVISAMISVGEDGKLASNGELMLIISLVVGAFLGEWLRIDDRLTALSNAVETRFSMAGFAKSFTTGTLIYCIGAMTIIGSINDGLGDPTVLLIKSLLDGVASVVLAATLGPGVIFSAVPVFLIQSAIALMAGVLAPVLQGELLLNICAVGYSLVICIGFNFMGVAKIKTANLLPALLGPVLWYAGNYAVAFFS